MQFPFLITLSVALYVYILLALSAPPSEPDSGVSWTHRSALREVIKSWSIVAPLFMTLLAKTDVKADCAAKSE
jgi:hypothetical protein